MKQKQRDASDMVVGKMVLVAVKASKEISRTSLVWALTHVVQPGDFIKLLVVIPSPSSSKKMWGFSRFTTDCATSHRMSFSGTSLDQRDDVVESCSQMMCQLYHVYDPEKIKIRIKVVSDSPFGVVAAEAKRAQSNWVILDKRLKHEKKYCMEDLQCNVVVMKRSLAKVLRLNLNESHKMEPEVSFQLPFGSEPSSQYFKGKHDKLEILKGPFVTPVSSPEQESPLTTTDAWTSSISSSDPGTSPFLLSRNCRNRKKDHSFIFEENRSLYESESESDAGGGDMVPPSAALYFQPWTDDVFSSSGELSKHSVEGLQRLSHTALTSTYKLLLHNLSTLDQDPHVGVLNYKLDLNLSRSVREAVSLSRNVHNGPPPLCTVCQHKAPAFGHPPKLFTFAELKLATDGFSASNFLAEGGFGSVHRGVFQDGKVVAVKQHKLASSQGDVEFCSEVEVLSCAQHRNVVMLIGFCVEEGKRLLVYEYVCNGSLDSHLYGRGKAPLEWPARKKIALGAARGLRYLHEECRVGCIVHRDMRPNNILLTHDFEPLVGDFGLARWQPNGDMGEETRVIGTFGYLAPEYAQSGQITEKADVYSFGVVLLELVTGRKAIDINRPKGQQCLTEWARPLLEKEAIDVFVDPLLRNCYSEQEVYSMLQSASFCIRRDPHSRPRMSQVLRILEG